MTIVRPIYLRIVDRTVVDQANQDDARGLQIAAQRIDKQPIVVTLLNFLLASALLLAGPAIWIGIGILVWRIIR